VDKINFLQITNKLSYWT